MEHIQSTANPYEFTRSLDPEAVRIRKQRRERAARLRRTSGHMGSGALDLAYNYGG